MKILFVLPYPLSEAPSQRFRVEQYFGVLKANGHQWHTSCFLNEGFSLRGDRGTLHKLLALSIGFLRRFFSLFTMSGYDFVFIHREASPAGPPLFEWIVGPVLRKKIIYDYDDAIWMTDNLNESGLMKAFRWRSKVRLICKWSHKVSAGNNWLADFARTVNDNVVINPTTIDTASVHNVNILRKHNPRNQTIIGWTGSSSTLKYLEGLQPVLQTLQKKFPLLHVIVIADKRPELQLTSWTFRPWTKETEMNDLLDSDIGIMPLPDDEWSKGKCGFKALQYMALAIPAVVSPVGVNTDIVADGINGMLCANDAEWEGKLARLINDASLRNVLGSAGQATVEARYSVRSNTDNFLDLFARFATSVRATR